LTRVLAKKTKTKKIIIYLLVCAVVFSVVFTLGSNSLFADSRSQVTEFVTRFYQLCLDRSPDEAGLKAWVDQLLAKKTTGAKVAEGFIFSQEFMAKNTSNEDFVTILYRAFFNREPDGGGFSSWLGLLKSGYSRQFVLAGFVNSYEFKKLCTTYGIIAGKLDPGASMPTIQITTGKLPVILLHGIEPSPSGRYEISNGAFDYLCGALKSYGYQTITLLDLANHFDKGKPLPAKPVIITSDDGYQSMYTNAFPILKKYGYKMTVFLITSMIGDKEAARRLNDFDYGDNRVPQRAMLIWPEVRVMSKYGCEFQSHTWSHRIISNIPVEDARMELAQSKSDIEINTGKPCIFVAWPHGQYSGEVLGLLGATGYRGALHADGGVNDLADFDFYNILRVSFVSELPPDAYAQALELQ